MPILLVGLMGFGGGFFVARGADAVGDIIKWGVVGGGAYLVAKKTNLI